MFKVYNDMHNSCSIARRRRAEESMIVHGKMMTQKGGGRPAGEAEGSRSIVRAGTGTAWYLQLGPCL